MHSTKPLMTASLMLMYASIFAACIPAVAWGGGCAKSVCRDEAKVSEKPVANVPDKIPFAFSISGGISLGSYEAGLNWAFIRYLQKKRDEKPDADYIPPDLTAVAGTSAGSINAFLTAATWCRDESLTQSFDNHVGSNLFFKTWLNVDLEQLMKEHTDTDAVLSRKPFNGVLSMLGKVLGDPVYRDGCKVPIGVIVTRNDSIKLNVDGITADNDRFVIPLIMKAGSDNRLTFEPYPVSRDDTSFGNAIYPQGNRDNNGRMTIPTDQVLQVLQASSAFPVAFGQKEIRYCIRKQDVPNDILLSSGSTCPEGYVEKTAHFVDGGVFDNVPLGTAKRLAEDEGKKRGRRTTYLYMDPGNVRALSLREENAKSRRDKEVTYGLLGGMRFLGGALATGTTYELYSQLRSGEWNHQSRKLTGRVVEALDQWQVDNGEGMGSAEASCQVTLAGSKDKLASVNIPRLKQCLLEDQKCLEANASSFTQLKCRPSAHHREGLQKYRDEIIENLCSVSNNLPYKDLKKLMGEASANPLDDRKMFLSSRYAPLTGNYLGHFGAFIDPDFRKYDYYAGIYDAVVNLAQLKCSTEVTPSGDACMTVEASAVYKLLDVNSDKNAAAVFAILANKEFGWNWPRDNSPKDNSLGQPDDNIRIIGETFTGSDSAPSQRFVEFIKALKQEKKFKPKGVYLKKIMSIESDEELVLLYPIIQDALARIRKLEADESKQYKLAPLLRTGAAFTELFASSLIGDDGSSSWTKGHTPHWYWNWLLPYEIGTDPMNGALYAAWEPRITLRSKVVTIDPKIVPLGWDKFGRDHILFSQMDAYLTYHKNSFLVPSLGLGPSVNYIWEKWDGYPRFNVGMAGYLSFVGDKVRLTVGSRSFRRTFKGDNIYLNLGLTDFPGILHALKDTMM